MVEDLLDSMSFDKQYLEEIRIQNLLGRRQYTLITSWITRMDTDDPNFKKLNYRENRVENSLLLQRICASFSAGRPITLLFDRTAFSPYRSPDLLGYEERDWKINFLFIPMDDLCWLSQKFTLY